MKKVLFLLAVGLCMVAVVMAAPNFSGSWTLNTSKSDMGQRGASAAGGGERSGGGAGSTAKSGERSGAPSGGGMGEMTIKMTGNEMIVTQGTQETKYILDGKDQTFSSGRGGELKYKATWAGNVLTLAGTRGDSPYKLTWEMSADGKTLTRTSTSGETVRKMVYDKK